MNGRAPLLRITAADRVLVLAVHPDDESLATGGLLRRAVSVGASVRVIFVTDGENNPWPQRVIERRWRIGPTDRARWGRRRRQEALSALSRLGVAATDARFLGWPDQGLTGLLLGGLAPGAVAALAGHVRDWRPSLLLAPSLRDLHPDHNALAVLLRLALDRREIADDPRGLRTLDYVVHGEVPSSVTGVGLPLFVWEKHAKSTAIAAHVSQLRLSRRRFLAYATDEERFEPPGSPERADGSGFAPHHPRWMRRHTLEWRLQRPLQFWERLKLLLVRVPAPGEPALMAHSLTLPRTGGVAVRLPPPVPASAGEIEVQVERRRIFVRLPAGLLCPGGRCFAKLHRRGIFLDDAGWQDLSAPWSDREADAPSTFRSLEFH